jgi:hypothetical protein
MKERGKKVEILMKRQISVCFALVCIYCFFFLMPGVQFLRVECGWIRIHFNVCFNIVKTWVKVWNFVSTPNIKIVNTSCAFWCICKVCSVIFQSSWWRYHVVIPLFSEDILPPFSTLDSATIQSIVIWTLAAEKTRTCNDTSVNNWKQLTFLNGNFLESLWYVVTWKCNRN